MVGTGVAAPRARGRGEQVLSRLYELLAGRAGYALAGLMLLTFLYLAFEPFRWHPPRRVANGAEVGPQGTVRFQTPGLVRTTKPPDWLDWVSTNHRFSVRLRVRAETSMQYGPARIFTISPNFDLRNVTIGQEASDLVVRIRRRNSSHNGLPAFTVPGVFAEAGWRDIEVSVRPESVTIGVDGRRTVSKPLPPRPLENWNTGFRVALGNEMIGRRPWLGEIAEATVRVEGRQVDYLQAGRMDRPARFWSGLDLRTPLSPTYLLQRDGGGMDILLNLAYFVPLGFVLAAARGDRSPLVFAVAVCAVASMGVEIAQLGFETRGPSIVDLFLNTLGAALGAWFATRTPTGAGTLTDHATRVGEREL